MSFEVHCDCCGNQFWSQEQPTDTSLCPGCFEPLGSHFSSKPDWFVPWLGSVWRSVRFGVLVGIISGPLVAATAVLAILLSAPPPTKGHPGLIYYVGNAFVWAVFGSILGVLVGLLIGTLHALTKAVLNRRGSLPH